MRKHIQHNPHTSTTVSQQKTSNKIQTTVKLKEEDLVVKDHKKEKDDERSSSENGLRHNGDSAKSHQRNGSGDSHQIIPPKPLPRASRASSLSETEDVTVAPPKPKPRTATSTSNTPPPISVIPVVTSVNPTSPITVGYKVSIAFKHVLHSVICRIVTKQYLEIFLYCGMKVGSCIVRFKKNIMHFWDIFFVLVSLFFGVFGLQVSCFYHVYIYFLILGCEPFVPLIQYIFFIWVPQCGSIKGMVSNPWPARLHYVALSHIFKFYMYI